MNNFEEDDFRERYVEHHFEKTDKLINEVIEKRNEIINNGGDALGLLIKQKNDQNSKVNSSAQNNTSSMVDRERKNLERIEKIKKLLES